MTVSLLNNGSTSSGTSTGTNAIASAASGDLSDMFTKLLVAQIQNQDPLSPTDPAQFVQQLTQLSQTESLQSLTSMMSANNSVMQSMQILQLGGEVGADVMAETSTVNTDGSSAVSGQITLASSSAKTTLELTSADGTKYDINLGTQSPGDVPFTIDPVKLGLPAGSYSMAVQTSSGETPSVEVEGRLNSLRLAAGGSVVLNVSNIGDTATTSITAFNGKSSTATQSSL